MTLYRDPLAGLKSQVATKRGLVEQRERELAPLMRAMLPDELRKVIDEDRARVAAVRDDEASTTMEALTELDAAIDGLVAAYDEAIALVPKLRECPLDVVDPPKPAQPPPWLIEENRQRFFRVKYEERVREVSSDAYVVRWGDLRYLTRLKVAGAPLVAMTAGNFDIGAITTEFTSVVRTSVPPSTPAVTVKLKGAMGGVAKALGIARDDETGDAPFDDAFLVDGRDGGALLLTRDVTAALRHLEPWNVGLSVKNGLAEILWGGDFRGQGADLLHDAAFAVLLGVRAAIERA